MRQQRLKAVDRPVTLLGRIRTIDAALRVRSKDPRCIEAQDRLRQRRAQLVFSYLLMKGATI